MSVRGRWTSNTNLVRSRTCSVLPEVAILRAVPATARSCAGVVYAFAIDARR